MRAPLAFVYGNCVFAAGLHDPWAAFALPGSTYRWLPGEEKRARFLAMLGALHAIDADLQIVRVTHTWDAARLKGRVGERARSPHAGAMRRYVGAQLEHLTRAGAARVQIYLLASLREPERDVATYVSRAAER
ncbi:MAG: hypothetical protein FWD42_11245, partial [Solirubrobacterales bacterium]|nr:hypothetical protein [Solirubrobacterales bacterium]